MSAPGKTLPLLPPDQLYGALFHDVQMAHVFTDSKTFADCYPKCPPEEILSRYEIEKVRDGFRLDQFVQSFFDLPPSPGAGYQSDTSLPTAMHAERMWPVLTRRTEPNTTLLPVPHPYIVPGGRFRGLYYWDSYFTMLGLEVSDHLDLIRQMMTNFGHLIATYGHIPNANRTYFLSRSQPPFFAPMVRLLAGIDGPSVLRRYLPEMQKEHNFWMEGAYRLDAEETRYRRVAHLPDGTILNRYWDDRSAPRPESYREDVHMAHLALRQYGTPTEAFYRHVRAACESGWDFSARWFADGHHMTSIRTTDVLPVDLNCLLYVLEKTLADSYRLDHSEVAAHYDDLAEMRRKAILNLFWSESEGFFVDYDLVEERPLSLLTLAGLFPLYVGIATPEQAARVHERIRRDFLQAGGVVTTLIRSGQQWDSPIGWAPLQWIAYVSLEQYGYTDTAREIARRWLALNDKVFRHSGKMMEKYNVVDDSLTASGGEYPNQDGFGWTNGVYLRLAHNLQQALPGS